jgi:predicted nucleic acid-binding protein
LKPRAVLDASVLLSGERDELLYLAGRGIYTLVCSPFLIGEVVRIRVEKAIAYNQERIIYRTRINNYVNEITRRAEMVNHTLLEGGDYTRWLHDPDDEPLLATALVGRAEFIVSWNTKDFPPSGSYAHVRYVTPPQFLEELYSQYPLQEQEETH